MRQRTARQARERVALSHNTGHAAREPQERRKSCVPMPTRNSQQLLSNGAPPVLPPHLAPPPNPMPRSALALLLLISTCSAMARPRGTVFATPPAISVQEVPSYCLRMVPSPADYNNTAAAFCKHVPGLRISNAAGISMVVTPYQGAIRELNLSGVPYLWTNEPGAFYFNSEPNLVNGAPLTELGLIHYGGIMPSAVTAELGIYNDWDWSMEVRQGSDAIAVEFSVQDTSANRARVVKRSGQMAAGPYSIQVDSLGLPLPAEEITPMSKYPPSDLWFRFTTTLAADEPFVRQQLSVHNPSDVRVATEAWIASFLPVGSGSMVLREQAQIENWGVEYPRAYQHSPVLQYWATNPSNLWYPTKWPKEAKIYDFPTTDPGGVPVAVTVDTRAAAFVLDPQAVSFTKLWSWGDPSSPYNARGNGNQGRPQEPGFELWKSCLNSRFFQTAEVLPGQTRDCQWVFRPIPPGSFEQVRCRSDAMDAGTIAAAGAGGVGAACPALASQLELLRDVGRTTQRKVFGRAAKRDGCDG